MVIPLQPILWPVRQALASLDLLLEKSCLNRIKEIQNLHEQFVQKELSKVENDFILNIRILGTILAFEINTGKNEYINQVGAEIMKQAMLHGIYLRPLGNTVYVMPPYCISNEQLRKVYEFILSIQKSLKQVWEYGSMGVWE